MKLQAVGMQLYKERGSGVVVFAVNFADFFFKLVNF